jgi:hypothetical protein
MTDPPDPDTEPTFDPATRDESRAARVAMTAAAVAYPLVAVPYFWADWFRFLRPGVPMLVEPPMGVLIPAIGAQLTLLSPWRLLAAGVTAALLGVSARRLRRGAPGAHALSLVVLLGLVLPQVFWCGEFFVDWFQGRGFLTACAAWLVAVAVPAVAVARRGALDGWGALREGRGRVVLAAASMGWVAFATTVLFEHARQFVGAGAAFTAAFVAMGSAALGMVGLLRQRTWGLVASLSAAVSLALVVFGVRESYVSIGSLMDVVMAGPVQTATALVPGLLLVGLLGPFIAGFFRRAVGQEPDPQVARAPSLDRLRVEAAAAELHDEGAAEDEIAAAEEAAARERRRA